MRTHSLNETGAVEDALRRSARTGRGDPASTDAAARREDEHAAAGAARRLTARVAAEGLTDVSYTSADSPFGTLLLASTRLGLVRLAFPEEDVDSVLDGIAGRISPRIVETPAPLDPVCRELEEYFSGSRHEFALKLDWALIAGFGRRVLRVTSEIPYGGVLSYGEVAAEAGSPRGSRAAGNALGSNPIPIVIPGRSCSTTSSGHPRSWPWPVGAS